MFWFFPHTPLPSRDDPFFSREDRDKRYAPLSDRVSSAIRKRN